MRIFASDFLCHLCSKVYQKIAFMADLSCCFFPNTYEAGPFCKMFWNPIHHSAYYLITCFDLIKLKKVFLLCNFKNHSPMYSVAWPGHKFIVQCFEYVIFFNTFSGAARSLSLFISLGIYCFYSELAQKNLHSTTKLAGIAKLRHWMY